MVALIRTNKAVWVSQKVGEYFHQLLLLFISREPARAAWKQHAAAQPHGFCYCFFMETESLHFFSSSCLTKSIQRVQVIQLLVVTVVVVYAEDNKLTEQFILFCFDTQQVFRLEIFLESENARFERNIRNIFMKYLSL